MKTKAILCRKIGTGEMRVFSITEEAAAYLDVSRQAVGRALGRDGATCAGCEIRYTPRFFVVKDRESRFHVCTYDAKEKKFVKVNRDGFILERLALSYRDVTAALLEEKPEPMGWRLARDLQADGTVGL